MNRLPLRYKMTLLYSLLTMVFCACLLVLLYCTARRALMRGQEAILSLAYAQFTALIEVRGGQYTVEDELKLPVTASYQALDPSGQTLLSYRMPAALSSAPFDASAMRRIALPEGNWLLLDGIDSGHARPLHIRMALSLEEIEYSLRIIRGIAWIAMPLSLLFAVGGGLFVSRRSLRPIDRIIATAKIVALGDLSERIPDVPMRDEIGELTRTMNDMLSKLETSFQREKRFTSDASHELRTPVSVILAYAESLAREIPPGDEAADAIQTILAESERMRRVIAQLLTITRGEEGGCAIERAPVDMAEVARGVSAQMRAMARERGITIRVDAAPGAQAIGDQSLFTQLMINLVENALQYGRPGGRVDILVAPAAGARCGVSVSDDGIGIAPEHLPHLFERFYRADPARNRNGCGLGLSIAKWIVEAHGGRIEVRSEMGAGSVFSVVV